MCCKLDAFYNGEAARQTAKEWHKHYDEEGVGLNGIFGKQHRRGSFGEFDLDAIRNTYFETREEYERLRAARRKADPDGVFTPNTFCVKC